MFRIGLSLCQKHSQHKDAHELLSVLCAMHEGHGGASGDLCFLEEALGLAAIDASEDRSDELDEDPSHRKSQHGREHQSIDDADPLTAVDAADPALQGNGCTGQTGDQCVAFAGGNAKIPSGRRP